MRSHEASSDEDVPTYVEVVEAVAAEKGVDPLALEPPLYDVLDPEALDALYGSPVDSGATLRVRFSYAGCTVVVDAEGRIDVER